MRLRIEVDSATTAEVRAVMCAWHKVEPTHPAGARWCEVKLNGPECWSLRTPLVASKDGEALLRFAAHELADRTGSFAATRGSLRCSNCEQSIEQHDDLGRCEA